MSEYVYRWSCRECQTSFIMYIDRKPEACPNCGRPDYAYDRDILYKISDLEIEVEILE